MSRSFAGAIALGAALFCAVPAAAQQAAEIDRSAWSAGDEDRSTVMRFLERDDVAAVAAGIGYDVQDIGRAVLDLSDEDASRAADEIRSADESIAADTISFTTTTLIIILLAVILLVLIAD